MGGNFLKKLFLDFFILSLLFYEKSCKSNMLAFVASVHLLTNMVFKIFQSNRIYFLTKLFLINNSENIEKLKKEFQDKATIIDCLVHSEKKKLRDNIFYQNLFVVPMVNQVALAHYLFKNYRSYLICFYGFCLLVLSNHFLSFCCFSFF